MRMKKIIIVFCIISVAIVYKIKLNNNLPPVYAASDTDVIAEVEPNRINELNKQLNQKEKNLKEKEREILLEKERDKIVKYYKIIILILVIGIALSLGLIILNFYLDYRRRKKENEKQK